MELSPQWAAIILTILLSVYTHYIARQKDTKAEITKVMDDIRRIELGYTELKTRFEYGVLAQTRRAARESHEENDTHGLDDLLGRYEQGVLSPADIGNLMVKLQRFIAENPEHPKRLPLEKLLDGLIVLYMPVETLQNRLSAAVTHSVEADRRHMEHIVRVISRLG